MLSLSDILVVGSTVFFTALIAYQMLRINDTPTAPMTAEEVDPVAFLFDDGVLHHATGAASALLPAGEGPRYWAEVRDALLPLFPGFPDLPNNGDAGSIKVKSAKKDDPQEVHIDWRDALCWVTLQGAKQESLPEAFAELKALRTACSTIPYPVWMAAQDGTVCWQNEAFANLVARTGEGKPFGDLDQGAVQRVRLENGKECFEVSSTQSGDVVVYHATCINALVAAEEAQHNFVQTLTKTFAYLSTGLAIFDKNGQLALFNPALVDLTRLRADFLSARPTMLSFFDQLRENRHMPEPKNYRNWRQEIAEVISAAEDGRYQETWTLESGQTFKVSGRPHPDGATAFLIEDISAEVAVTRNFRAELEQTHGLIDAVDDAMVVFSPSGVLTLCNASYRTLWNMDPDAAFTDMTIADCARIWAMETKNRLDWRQIEACVMDHQTPSPHDMSFTMPDGLLRTCTIEPLSSGTTLIRFLVQSANAEPVKEQALRAG